MRWRRFNVLTAFLAAFAFSGVAAMNLFVDPYGVFRLGSDRGSSTLNERFNKVRFLLEHKDTYDSFLVGSSRMGLYDPTVADALVQGSSWYNLAVFGGQAKDGLVMLKALKGNGVVVRRVLVGLDLFAFVEQDREVTPAYRHHPAVTGESEYAFYAKYLFAPSLYHSYVKLKGATETPQHAAFRVETTGQYLLPAWAEARNRDPERYIKEKFRYELQQPADAVWIEERFAELEEFVKWLDENGIERRFFIQPHHDVELAGYSGSSLDGWKSRIGRIVGEVKDLSRRCPGDSDWYDLNHFSAETASGLLGEVIQGSTMASRRDGKEERGGGNSI